MTLTSKWVVRVVLTLAAAIALVWALRPRPMAVETALVVRGPLSASVVAEGRTRVKDLYVVATPVDGQLERIPVESGDPIASGAVVARVWPVASRPLDARSRAEASAAVNAARASLTQAEASAKEAAASLTHAETVFVTAKNLARGGAAAEKDAEHAEHEVEIRRQAVDVARAAVQAARAALERAEASLASGASRPVGLATVIQSPVKGSVLRVLRESAGPVQAGMHLAEIGDTSAMEVTADLLTADAMSVRPGAAATISDWGNGQPLSGRVRRVDSAAFTKVSALGLEEQRVRVVVDLADPPPPGFGHDFRVTVSIVVWTGQDVLAIPSSALFRSGDRWAVFVLRNGQARLVPVTPGQSDALRTSVESGLNEADEVVIQPSDTLQDGTRISAMRRPTPSPR